MDLDFIDRLESFWKKVKEWDVLGHIIKIKDMLLHPRHFWQEYEEMPIKGKLIQFATYLALFAITIWLVSYDKLTIADLAKIITMEVVALIVFVVIIYLANSIVKKEWGDIWFFVAFCCYVKFICLIPQLLSLKAAYQAETPLLMGIAAFISVVAELIILVYPAYVRQKSKQKIIFAILLSVVFLNVYDSFYIVTGFSRPSNSNYENAIARERYELGKSIKYAYDIPTYAVSSDRSKDIWYLYSNPTDSVASLKFNDMDRYFKDLSEDIDSLKAISGRCRFKTNRAFFDEMYQLKKEVRYVHETKMYSNSPIIKQTDVMMDSIIVDRIYYRVFNRNVEEENVRLMRQEFKEAEQFNMAFSSSYLGYLWHPVLFIWRFYENRKL